MTARWGKGYIQMVWWINKHECSISNVFLCVIALPLSGTFKGHKIGMGFLGGWFWVQGFFGVLLEALGIFLGLDFWPHSIIPVTWNPKYPPWDPTYHVNDGRISTSFPGLFPGDEVGENVWTGGLPHLSGLPYLPGVPHLHVNRP